MYPLISKRVKVICEGGHTQTGIVEANSSEELVLRLVDESLFIVPSSRIIAVSVPKETQESSNPSDVFIDTELKPTKYFKDEGERVKNLAELRLEVAGMERKNARDHMNKKTITSIPETTFGLPNFTKPIPNHPKKKA